MKYEVIIIRTGYSRETIIIEADSIDDAAELACEEAYNRDFSTEYASEHNVEYVMELT